jgi:hypothetical protein
MKKLSLSNLVSFPAILLFIVLSSSTMVGQSVSEKMDVTISLVNNDDDKITSSKSEISAETNFNFVSWFMGTKQTIQEESVNEKASAKKMLINARIAPNRLLMKAFLKKAQNQLSSLA